MTKLFVSGTEGRAYQEFRGRDLNYQVPKGGRDLRFHHAGLSPC